MELPSPTTEEEQCCHLIDILKQRAKHTPDHVLYSLLNSRGVEVGFRFLIFLNFLTLDRISNVFSTFKKG